MRLQETRYSRCQKDSTEHTGVLVGTEYTKEEIESTRMAQEVKKIISNTDKCYEDDTIGHMSDSN